MKFIKIHANGTIENGVIKGDTLSGLQGAVGGYIQEVVPFPIEGVAMLCDEEGKLKSEPIINQLANRLANRSTNHPDPIVGDVVLVGFGGEDFTDVPQNVIDALVGVEVSFPQE